MDQVLGAPAALLSIAIEPNCKADQDAFAEALAALAVSAPEITVRTDAESGQIVIMGPDEVHLSTALEHRPEKWTAVFGQSRCGTRTCSIGPSRRSGPML